jgi:hypothetical protein
VGVRSISLIATETIVHNLEYYINCLLSCLKADGQMTFCTVPKVFVSIMFLLDA